MTTMKVQNALQGLEGKINKIANRQKSLEGLACFLCDLTQDIEKMDHNGMRMVPIELIVNRIRGCNDLLNFVLDGFDDETSNATGTINDLLKKMKKRRDSR